MAAPGVLGRRERLRAETTAEIKSVALALMASDGPDGITLRAIARTMGMTANAIYGYFGTRDDLITALINDVATALADDVEAAWTATASAKPATRLCAWANAFRDWSLANPQGFRLIFGDPVPGYETPAGGPAPEATRRICTGLIALADMVWPHVSHLYEGSTFDWSDFDAGLRAEAQHSFPDLPPAGVAHALQIRGRLHGLVSLEIYGHTSTQMRRPERLYAAELAQLTSVFEDQPR
jgi:AcrR family transcriptional regulator